MKSNNLLSILLLCLMLSSIANARSIESLNQNWKYYKGDANGAENPSFNDNAWTTVHLPHTFEYAPYHFTSFYRGIGWYRNKLTIGNEYAGKKLFIEFEGAMTTAEVYVNGTNVMTHKGGYVPFVIDITDNVTLGNENTIAVRLDNTYQGMVPPEKPDGHEVDYVLFGGIYRDVYLIATDKLYVPFPYSASTAPGGGIVITTPNVSPSSATVVVKTVIKNEDTIAKSCVLKTIIKDKNGATVSTLETTQNINANQTFTFTQTTSPAISNPSLWSHTNPSLYTAVTEVYDNTTVTDTFSTRFGIRSIRCDRNNGFYLNDRHVKLLGVNRHQTYPFIGGAMPNRGQRLEAKLLKEMGCNFVRLSHYPQDPSFLDACDELGIMLWEEVPTWMGWNLPQEWRNLHYQQIKDMIRRDRNHPCIIMWGVGLNEGGQYADFEEESEATAKAEDNTRFTTTARNYQTATDPFDLYGNNYFTPPLPNSNPCPDDIGYINSEHTGHTYPTHRYDDEARHIELSHRHEVMTDEACTRNWVAGTAAWCAFDYNTDPAVGQDENGMCYHGVTDLFRIPKFAYYFYQSQCAADDYDGSKNPMVFIESFGNYAMPSTQSVKIFSNCEQVELFVNDQSVGTRSPDGGTSLAHPPFTFPNVEVTAPGTLRAEGTIGGTVKATHTVRHPGSASQIQLRSDADALSPDGSDLARVVVSVTDNNGTVIRSASHTIRVTVSGPGKVICGPGNPSTTGDVEVEAGQLAFFVQAGMEEGVIILSAETNGLAQGLDTIVTGNPTGTIPHRILPISYNSLQPAMHHLPNGILFNNLDRNKRTRVLLCTMNGRTVKMIESSGSTHTLLNTTGLPTGMYTIIAQCNAYTLRYKVFLVK